MTDITVVDDANIDIFTTHCVVELTSFRQQHGTVPLPMEFNVTTREVDGETVTALVTPEVLLSDVQEMLRDGQLNGIDADPTADLTGYHTEAFPAKDGQPNRVLIRSKAEFGR